MINFEVFGNVILKTLFLVFDISGQLKQKPREENYEMKLEQFMSIKVCEITLLCLEEIS